MGVRAGITTAVGRALGRREMRHTDDMATTHPYCCTPDGDAVVDVLAYTGPFPR